MKTYYWTPEDMELDSTGGGEFVKTADVAVLQDQLKAERAKSATLVLRFDQALTSMAALVEQARKGAFQHE